MPTFRVSMDTGGPDEPKATEFPDAKTAACDAQVAMAEIAGHNIPGE